MNANPRIIMKPDTLDEEAARFAMAPLEAPVFLNSVPKSGTHLIRNIVRMFVPIQQQYRREFVQLGNLQNNLAAFAPGTKLLSWGHLLFSDTSAVALRDVRHVLLVRDPYDWVLARARFFLSEEFQGRLNNIKHGAAAADDVLNLMIFGAFDKNPALSEIFNANAVAWLGTKAKVFRYEDIIASLKALDSPQAEDFFRRLFGACGIAMPADWRERVRIGSDRKHSGTARENLTGQIEVPDVLPDAQKRLVDYHAPGLRRILGYE
ncbi:MAG TPA: hypothetical protein VG841_09495 [Caulobacterales bacterium]|nr:hypothetical protein [Caulobacterales bacterium]